MANCRNCNTRFNANDLKKKEQETVTKQILATFHLKGGHLFRTNYLNESYMVTPAVLYTLTGGRRVTASMVYRVLNGLPLYRSPKRNAS